MEKKQLLIISGNQKKIEQLGQILSDNFKFNRLALDLPQIQGESEQIAREKVISAFNITKKPVLIEDTSLCYNAYKGLPGPFIKYFWKSIGCQGLAKMLDSFEDKSATAVSIIAYMDQKLEQPILFIGKSNGKIVKPRGNLQLGWEPIFQHQGYEQTYGQMAKQIKNKISYRYISIKKMEQYFLENNGKDKNQAIISNNP